MVGRTRIAVYGGDGHRHKRKFPNHNVRAYSSRRAGGNGQLRRLCKALKAGRIDLVIILKRWVGHSGSGKVRRLCKKLGVPLEVR